MITTEINLLDHTDLSEYEYDTITLAAKEDCERKLREFNDDFDITDYNIEFEFICKVNIGTFKLK